MDEDYKLYEIVVNSSLPYLRKIALSKITNPKYLHMLRLQGDEEIQKLIRECIG